MYTHVRLRIRVATTVVIGSGGRMLELDWLER